MRLFVFALLLCGVYRVRASIGYNFPKPEIKVLHPKGLRVSIPDEDGIELFSFHGNVNREMENLEAGQMSKDIIKKRRGKWTFKDKGVTIKKGDTLYFWLFVIKDGLGYRYDNGKYVYNGPAGRLKDSNPSSTSKSEEEAVQLENTYQSSTPKSGIGQLEHVDLSSIPTLGSADEDAIIFPDQQKSHHKVRRSPIYTDDGDKKSISLDPIHVDDSPRTARDDAAARSDSRLTQVVAQLSQKLENFIERGLNSFEQRSDRNNNYGRDRGRSFHGHGFRHGSPDGFGYGHGSGFGHGPPGGFGYGPPGGFRHGPPGGFGHGPPDGFGHGPPGGFGYGPPGRFGPEPPGRYGHGPPRGHGPPERFGSGPPERFGSGQPEEFQERPPGEFEFGPPGGYGREPPFRYHYHHYYPSPPPPTPPPSDSSYDFYQYLPHPPGSPHEFGPYFPPPPPPPSGEEQSSTTTTTTTQVPKYNTDPDIDVRIG